MALEYDRCDECNAMIILTNESVGSHIECDECGTAYIVGDVCDDETGVRYKYIEQM